MNAKSDAFGRLLKGAINSIATYEGKTSPIIEDELGQQIGVVGATIQRYKSGKVPPETRTVQILAESAIKRGFLGREWLQRFLHAARYPGAQELVDELCPDTPARPRPARVYHNLPAPTYSQFIMREQAFADIVDGLRQRSASVLVVGLGGNGKTSLAREVSAHCLEHHDDAPHFDASVWISDKGREGTTNLSLVLDEIARTLDYPGFTQYAHDEKKYEIEQLLRRQKVLLILDNFETITDGMLMTWLLRLPEPSKAIITTRERHQAMWGSWLIELRGMNEPEAQELIQERLRVLKMHPLVSTPTQFEPLIAVTGGNPKAITIALGLLKHERQPIQQVVDDLYAARGNLFDDLFTRVWALLDDAARRILLVMPFFVDSASSEALAATADVQGFAFERAVERLTDFSLLDVLQTDLHTSARYVLHPLVQAFAQAKIAEQTYFEAAARERWVQWYVELTAKVGFCWNDLSKLEVFELEHNTICFVIEWTISQNNWLSTIQVAYGSQIGSFYEYFLGRGIIYYYFLRGFWEKKARLDLIFVEIARNISDLSLEVVIISKIAFLLSRQGNSVEAEPFIKRLQDLIQSTHFGEDVILCYLYALAEYQTSYRDFTTAQQSWLEAYSLAEKVGCIPLCIASLGWYATCIFRIGKEKEAYLTCQKVFRDATYYNYESAVVLASLWLAKTDIAQNNLDSAMENLEKSISIARKSERRYIAPIQATYAQLYTLRGDIPAAHIALTESIDLFERLGMQRELAEAREQLAQLTLLEATAT
jgi:hypothetical protein